jgi:acid stress-induced BolA-like protein IbaG/YrbA
MQANDIQKLIESALPGAQVSVEGEDGIHFQAVVVSEAFEGKSRVQQHRMVYRALGDRVESQEIHALGLRTLTPAQAAAGGGRS